MAKTPEGNVKKEVNLCLAKYPDVYSFMPVQMGYGKAGIDYHCTVRVRNISVAFFIETKRPGKELTDRQDKFVRERRAQCSKVFVIDNWAGVKELDQWLTRITRTSGQS